MKNILILILIFAFIGCESIDMSDGIMVSESVDDPAQAKTGGFTFNVSLKTAKYFAETQNPGKKLKSVEPLVYSDDTVMYLINYANAEGWMVLSGDKRFEPVLTVHETGNFSNESTNEGLDLWFSGIAENISYVKKNNLGVVNQEGYNVWAMVDKAANITPEIQEYYNKKYGIIPKEHYDIVEEDGKMIAKIKAQYSGYYGNEYIYLVKRFVSSTASPSYISRSVSLCDATWGQGDPYNRNLPQVYKSNVGYIQPPAGCAAVAMGMALLSLHYHIGKPNGLYHTVSSTGWIYDSKNYSTNFSRSNYNANSPLWDQMARSANQGNIRTGIVADFLADIGNRIGMSYGPDGSSATSGASHFTSWGISADESGYNSSTVLSQLRSNRVVLMRADSDRKKKGIWPFRYYDYSGGHAWIIDGYVERTTTYTYTYRWELATRCPQGDPYWGYYYDPYYPCDPYYTYYNDDPYDPCGRPCDPYVYQGSGYDEYGNEIDWNNNHYPGQTETSTYNYTSTNVLMNWGQWGISNGEYSPYSSNPVYVGSFTATYQYNQKLIYNFR